jgi:hypothetical protein
MKHVETWRLSVARSKCPETLPDLALKGEHLPPIMSKSLNMPGKTAPHLASSIDPLCIRADCPHGALCERILIQLDVS